MLRVEDPTDNHGRGWREMTGHEIAELLYFTVRTAPKHLRYDLNGRNPIKGDYAARRIAEMLAERLRGYPVFGPARLPESHTCGPASGGGGL